MTGETERDVTIRMIVRVYGDATDADLCRAAEHWVTDLPQNSEAEVIRAEAVPPGDYGSSVARQGDPADAGTEGDPVVRQPG